MSLVCSMHLCQQWLLKIHIVHPRMHASDTCVSHQDFRLSKERFGISIDCGWHRTSFLEPPTCDHWQSNVYHMLNSEPTLSKRCTFEQSLLQSLGYTCWWMVICPIQFLHQNSSMVNVEPSDRQCPTDQCVFWVLARARNNWPKSYTAWMVWKTTITLISDIASTLWACSLGVFRIDQLASS